jgi:hypothetical protein
VPNHFRDYTRQLDSQEEEKREATGFKPIGPSMLVYQCRPQRRILYRKRFEAKISPRRKEYTREKQDVDDHP